MSLFRLVRLFRLVSLSNHRNNTSITQFFQQINITIYQCDLLSSCPTMNLPLSLKCFFNRLIFFYVN